MAAELSLDSIKEMKKADYVKAFKDKNSWKKAKAVIVLVDYKLEGKKAVIAIPFKKEAEMKQEMKRLKKEKLHVLKKSGGGTIEITKKPDGTREANIEISLGGLKPELLTAKAGPLFEKIKVALKALQTAEAAAEAAAAEGEVDPNENLPEDSLEDVAVDDSADEDAPEDDSSVVSSISTMVAQINNLFKEKVQGAVNAIKGNEATEEHLEHAEETASLIDELKEIYDSASDAVKAQVSGAVDKIMGLVPNLDKIKSKLSELFNGKGDAAEGEADGVLSQVKELMKGIGETFKEKVQKVVVPALKNNEAVDEHLEEIESLGGKIEEVKEMVKSLSADAKAAVDANLQKILGLVPNLDKIKDKLSGMLGDKTGGKGEAKPTAETAEKPANKEFEKLIKDVSKRVSSIGGELDGVAKAVEEAGKSAMDSIKSGAELIADLF